MGTPRKKKYTVIVAHKNMVSAVHTLSLTPEIAAVEAMTKCVDPVHGEAFICNMNVTAIFRRHLKDLLCPR